MSVENVKKLELGINKAAFGEGISENTLNDKLLQQLIDEGMLLIENAMQSGEIDVLDRAFDYFLEEDPDNGLGNGVCESLESDIFMYFSWEQVLNVLKQKFNDLIKYNISRAVHFAGACLNTGRFEEFRSIFNFVRPAKSEEFLNELTDWYSDEYSDKIMILYKDTTNWK